MYRHYNKEEEKKKTCSFCSCNDCPVIYEGCLWLPGGERICSISNCYKGLNCSQENYCSSHVSECPKCKKEISIFNEYCSEHGNVCRWDGCNYIVSDYSWYKGYCSYLKLSDLPEKYHNWGQYLTSLDSNEKLSEFLTEFSQVVEKQVAKRTLSTSQPEPNYLGLKITLGIGASLVIISALFLVVWRKKIKKKKR